MTTTRLPLLPDDELARVLPADDEGGVGALATERGNLPLEAIDVRAAVAGLLARTELAQTFVNPYDEPIEATYIFPLPDRAAVTGFRMEVAGRVVEGVLEERAKARAAYDEAVAEGRRASIAEEERPGVFTMRVGNLLPGERATVRLRMAGPLPYSDGEATYRFPLVVAPRYIPGTPLPGPWVGDGTVPDTDAVPDASRITPPVLLPGFPNPVRLSLEVEVDPAGLPLHGLSSSLHAVCDHERDGRRVVRMQPGERANRDFVLRLALGDEAVATALATVPDTGDGEDGEAREGTFALTLVPPLAARPARPRDVVVVLDRSGSMTGWKMVAARRAAARMVDTLGDADRFAVLAFDQAVEHPPALDADRLVPASDRNRFRAVEFLAALEARGGTEMAEPLRLGVERLTAARDLPAGDRERVLVLVTDGQVGNEDQLLGLLGPRLGDVRVFTVGIDTAVNDAFLRRLAGLGGGACELVESEDRLDAVMERIHRRVGSPVLTDLVVESAGLAIEPDSLSPSAPPGAVQRLPVLFAGAPLVVTGRWRGRPEGALTVRGREASGREWRAEVPASPGANQALAAIWARGRLRDLEDAYATGGGMDQDLERRIVTTSLRFGVLCRFTAFVAVDTAVVNQGGMVRRVTQPVDAPQGWEMFASAPAAPMAVAAGPATGGILAASSGAGRSAVARADAGGPVRRTVNPLLARAVRAPLSGQRERRGPQVEVPLDAYRRRAGELRTLLADADPEARGGLLAALRARLAELVEDLRSVGAPAAELRPLDELLDDVERSAATEPPVAAGELARLWERALAILGAFAAAGPAPAAQGAGPDRTSDFWKRPPR
jgi:Ca-activated chloride channel family protein